MFIFVFQDVFQSLYFTITIILFSLFVVIDKIFQQPVLYGKEETTRRDVIQTVFLIIFLFLNPIMLALPYLEYTYLIQDYIGDTAILGFWIIGSIILIIGGTVLSYSRYVIGKLGTLIIGVEHDHRLITSGPYRFIRHPIYAGATTLFLGFALSFSALLSSVLLLNFCVFLFEKRIREEEKLLVETFGEEYLEYMSHTKKIIPFLY